jgi:hypothetical protein
LVKTLGFSAHAYCAENLLCGVTEAMRFSVRASVRTFFIFGGKTWKRVKQRYL